MEGEEMREGWGEEWRNERRSGGMKGGVEE